MWLPVASDIMNWKKRLDKFPEFAENVTLKIDLTSQMYHGINRHFGVSLLQGLVSRKVEPWG